MTTPSSPKGIKDIFYETRVLMGREYTLRRFAMEVLGGSVDPVMVGYIEKGKRFPSEALVRRLAAVRKQDPHPLLALLWRDRMVHAFGSELRRVLHAPRGIAVDDGELAVRVSQAIAALPDDGTWISVARWRAQFRTRTRRSGGAASPRRGIMQEVERALRARSLIEIRGAKVRRRGRHFVPADLKQRHALALEFCTLFAKGLIDELALAETGTGTYLRNHYLHIEGAQLPAFQKELETALRALAEKFANDQSATTRFLNILVAATPL